LIHDRVTNYSTYGHTVQLQKELITILRLPSSLLGPLQQQGLQATNQPTQGIHNMTQAPGRISLTRDRSLITKRSPMEEIEASEAGSDEESRQIVGSSVSL
jgi:hypothetical protein